MKKWLILAVFLTPIIAFGAYEFIPKEYKAWDNLAVIKTSASDGSASEDVKVWRVDDKENPKVKCYVVYQLRSAINKASSGDSDVGISCVVVK